MLFSLDACRVSAERHASSFPYLLHVFVVSDLVRRELKLAALLHDCTEVWFGDIPSPVKPVIVKRQEKFILHRIFANLKVRWPLAREWKEIKEADLRARAGEAHALGTDNLRNHRDFAGQRDPEAEAMAEYYHATYNYADCLEENGRAVQLFLRKFESLKKVQ